MAEGYCVKCKAKAEMVDSKENYYEEWSKGSKGKVQEVWQLECIKY